MSPRNIESPPSCSSSSLTRDPSPLQAQVGVVVVVVVGVRAKYRYRASARRAAGRSTATFAKWAQAGRPCAGGRVGGESEGRVQGGCREEVGEEQGEGEGEKGPSASLYIDSIALPVRRESMAPARTCQRRRMQTRT